MYRQLTGFMREASYLIGAGAGFAFILFSLQQPLHGSIPDRALQV